VVRAGPRREGVGRGHGRGSRRSAAPRGGLHGRHGRPRPGNESRRRRTGREAPLRGRQLRRRRLPDRASPFSGRPEGGRGNGACDPAPRRDRGQRLHRRARRASREASRPYACPLLLRRRVEGDADRGRARGRAAGAVRAPPGRRRLARPRRHTTGRCAARARTARRQHRRGSAHVEVDRRQSPPEPELLALPATFGGAWPASTRRAAASSVAPGQTSPSTPCVLASLGARDPGIHQCHRQGH
jgi:hypothetical protein